MVRIGPRLRGWAVAVLLLGLAAGGVVFLRPPSSSHAPATDPLPLDLDDPVPENPGYVGLHACAACHAERVAQFQKTNHYLACREVGVSTILEGFASGKGTFVAREPGLRFEMTRTDAGIFLNAIQASAAGERRASTPVAWVYGAGDADEVYFGWHGDRLYELPISWLHPQQCWGISPPYRYSIHQDFSREATPRCVECHNTWVGHLAGTLNQYRRDGAIVGVTCERCHGPGREHLAFHEAHPEARTGEYIVHPGSLSRERQIDVCAQCHSNAIKHRTPPFTYRPGHALEESFKTLSTKYAEDDRVANQTQYLRRSKCFQKSDTMTCLTCHDPHSPKSPAATAAVAAACLKCHAPADCMEQPRLPSAVRGDCAGCHMPKGVKINVHFHTEDEEYVAPILRAQHRIAIYPAARQAVLLAWYRTQTDAGGRQEADRLAKELVAHWQAEADECRKAYRFTGAIAALREALRIDPTPAVRAQFREAVSLMGQFEADSIQASRHVQEKRFPEAIAAYQAILRVKPDDAMAHGRLGMLYAATGRDDQAAQELLAVARCDPDEPYGFAELGWVKYVQGKPDEAAECYRQAEVIEPFDAKINHHWGLALLDLGQPAEAEQRLRRAVAIDPRNAGAHQALAIALRRQSKADEAIDFARRAVRLTGYENPHVLVNLAETYADARRPREAEEAINKALDAARRTNPDLLPAIHERGVEIRLRAKQPPLEVDGTN